MGRGRLVDRGVVDTHASPRAVEAVGVPGSALPNRDIENEEMAVVHRVLPDQCRTLTPAPQ